MAIGAYIIQHPSGLFYIGSATDLIKRRDEHKSRLRNNGHHVKRLQDAYNANNELVWEYHYTATREEAFQKEKELIQLQKGDPGILNYVYTDWKPVVSQAARNKSTELRTGVPLTTQHRKNISHGLKNNPLAVAGRIRAAEKNRRTIKVCGKEYRGAAEVAKEYGVNKTTVARRCRSKDPRFKDWSLL